MFEFLSDGIEILEVTVMISIRVRREGMRGESREELYNYF